MVHRFYIFGVSSVFLWQICLAQNPVSGLNHYNLRGKQQEITLFKANTPDQEYQGKVLYMPGDGGLRGFSVDMCKTMSGWGYDVYALDTKTYLSGFTEGKITLQVSEVMRDLREIVQWIRQSDRQRIFLAGWSEGAGLCLLGTADSLNRDIFQGLVTIGLDNDPVLGWRLVDDITWITKKNPKEPTFDSFYYLPKVSPLPLVMIQSTRDVYVPQDVFRKMFDAAREPKQYYLVSAQNHRYDGNHEGFFKALQEGLTWIHQIAQ